MAYAIEAIIAKMDTLKKANIEMDIVILLYDIGMLPLTHENRNSLHIECLLLENYQEIFVDKKLDGLGKTISEFGKVAFIQADFFGGGGSQACMVWENGNRIRLEVGNYAINHAIKEIDVNIGCAGKDEFDCLELGRFRHTYKWAEIAVQIAPAG